VISRIWRILGIYRITGILVSYQEILMDLKLIEIWMILIFCEKEMDVFK